MSSSSSPNFLASLSLRTLLPSDAAQRPVDAPKTLSAPPPFLCHRFHLTNGIEKAASEPLSELDQRRFLQQRLRQYPPAGIAVYNWNDGPGAWWRLLTPDQPNRNTGSEVLE